MTPDGLTGTLQRPAWRVLIVDDEPDIRESLRDLLEGVDDAIHCELAADGSEALAKLEAGRFDLIISDFKMPGMDGVEMLRRAGEAAPSTPRILITAFPDLQVAVRAINEAAIENFLTKPLDPTEVVDVVQANLKARDQRLQRDRAMARAMDTIRRGGAVDA